MLDETTLLKNEKKLLIQNHHYPAPRSVATSASFPKIVSHSGNEFLFFI